MIQQLHFWVSSHKLKQRLGEILYANIHNNIIKKVEPGQISISWSMDRQNVVYLHNILCSLNKEGNSDTLWHKPVYTLKTLR